VGRVPPNVLKLRKQKRQGRRAYLTAEFSTIHVPRSIGKSSIPEDSKPLFDYRGRMPGAGTIRFLNSIMPDLPIPERKELLKNIQEMEHKAIEWALNNPAHSKRRKYALSRAEEERLIAALEDPDVCDSYTVKDGGITKTRLTLVYNIRKTRCYFIEVAFREEGKSYMMKSSVYGAEDRALFAYRHKRIDWMEFHELSTLSLVLPRRGLPEE